MGPVRGRNVAEALVENVIRRKILAARAEVADGGPGADRGWRLGLGSAGGGGLKLPLDIASLVMEKRSLAELLELPPERGLILVLDGPSEGLGLLLISAPVLAGMIESALAGLESALAQEADLVWAGGFRFASFLEDARPLGLLLEDTSYRVLNAEVALGQGARTGAVILALPAEGRGVMPHHRTIVEDSSVPGFSEALALQVAAADCVLQAVVARMSLPLSRLMDLQIGEVMVLPRAGIDRITFEGLDGRAVAEGKLGQNRGMRAIRLTLAAAVSRPSPQETVAAVPAPMPEPLRQSA